MHDACPNQKTCLPNLESYPSTFLNVKKSDQCHTKSTNSTIDDVQKLNVIKNPAVITTTNNFAKDSSN